MSGLRSMGLFAAVSAGIIIVAWAVLRLVFMSEAQHQALVLSAGLAFAVQVGAFALLRSGAEAKALPGELMIRWGMGAVIRLVVLVMFAVVANALRLPLDAALVSLATFFFLTMIAEPLLLNHGR
jgi:hypothetical protein